MRPLIIGGANGIGAAIAEYIHAIYEIKPFIIDKMNHPYFTTAQYEFPLPNESERQVDSQKFTHVYVTLGRPSHRKFDDTDWGYEVALINGNFIAVTSALRLARANTYPDASFVVTSTVSSLSADPGGAIYSASKAGLNGLVKNLAREWVPARVNAIAPGPTATHQFLENVPIDNQIKERERSPHGRIMAPDDVAEAAVMLSEMRAVSGVVLPIDLAGISSSRRPM